MRKGSHHTPEQRKKISEAKKGKKLGRCPIWKRKKISEATKGVKKTITSPNPGWFPKGHIPWTKGRKKAKEILLKKVNTLPAEAGSFPSASLRPNEGLRVIGLTQM